MKDERKSLRSHKDGVDDKRLWAVSDTHESHTPLDFLCQPAAVTIRKYDDDHPLQEHHTCYNGACCFLRHKDGS